MSETGYITDFSHELWPERGAYPFHFHDDRVFWEFWCSIIHERAKFLDGCRGAVELVNRLLDDKFCYFILRKYRNKLLCFSVDFFSLCLTEVILLSSAPLLIVINEGIKRHLTNTVNMPVSGCKINPFLAAVTSGWAVKVSINARIGLIKDANKIIFHSRLMLHIEAKLTVHGFELIA